MESRKLMGRVYPENRFKNAKAHGSERVKAILLRYLRALLKMHWWLLSIGCNLHSPFVRIADRHLVNNYMTATWSSDVVSLRILFSGVKFIWNLPELRRMNCSQPFLQKGKLLLLFYSCEALVGRHNSSLYSWSEDIIEARTIFPIWSR